MESSQQPNWVADPVLRFGVADPKGSPEDPHQSPERWAMLVNPHSETLQ